MVIGLAVVQTKPAIVRAGDWPCCGRPKRGPERRQGKPLSQAMAAADARVEPYSRRPLFSRERIAMVDPSWSESVAAAVSNHRFAPWVR
jgi:hypothetical protein